MTTLQNAMNYTARELDALPRLAQGQAADLKVDDGDGVRVWLHRTGLADGEPYEHTITVETLTDGRWTDHASYDGGELDDDELDEGGSYELSA